MKLPRPHRKKLEELNLYQAVFNTAEGKRVLYDLMKVHHMTGPLPDRHPGEIHRAEGERNVVLRILSILNVDSLRLEEKLKAGLGQDSDYEE